jgi:hypothetical protein
MTAIVAANDNIKSRTISVLLSLHFRWCRATKPAMSAIVQDCVISTELVEI